MRVVDLHDESRRVCGYGTPGPDGALRTYEVVHRSESVVLVWPQDDEGDGTVTDETLAAVLLDRLESMEAKALTNPSALTAAVWHMGQTLDWIRQLNQPGKIRRGWTRTRPDYVVAYQEEKGGLWSIAYSYDGTEAVTVGLQAPGIAEALGTAQAAYPGMPREWYRVREYGKRKVEISGQDPDGGQWWNRERAPQREVDAPRGGQGGSAPGTGG